MASAQEVAATHFLARILAGTRQVDCKTFSPPLLVGLDHPAFGWLGQIEQMRDDMSKRENSSPRRLALEADKQISDDFRSLASSAAASFLPSAVRSSSLIGRRVSCGFSAPMRVQCERLFASTQIEFGLVVFASSLEAAATTTTMQVTSSRSLRLLAEMVAVAKRLARRFQQRRRRIDEITD